MIGERRAERAPAALARAPPGRRRTARPPRRPARRRRRRTATSAASATKACARRCDSISGSASRFSPTFTIRSARPSSANAPSACSSTRSPITRVCGSPARGAEPTLTNGERTTSRLSSGLGRELDAGERLPARARAPRATAPARRRRRSRSSRRSRAAPGRPAPATSRATSSSSGPPDEKIARQPARSPASSASARIRRRCTGVVASANSPASRMRGKSSSVCRNVSAQNARPDASGQSTRNSSPYRCWCDTVANTRARPSRAPNSASCTASSRSRWRSAFGTALPGPVVPEVDELDQRPIRIERREADVARGPGSPSGSSRGRPASSSSPIPGSTSAPSACAASSDRVCGCRFGATSARAPACAIANRPTANA